MLNQLGGEPLLAAIPSRQALEKLREELSLEFPAYDLYLAYAGGCGSRLAGCVVSEKTGIDQLIAFCPIHSDLAVASALWRREVSRQLKVAARIASGILDPHDAHDVVWLRYIQDAKREVPAWLYSVACVPVTHEWNGMLLYPRPFCPELFASMARQPQAPRWLMQNIPAAIEKPELIKAG